MKILTPIASLMLLVSSAALAKNSIQGDYEAYSRLYPSHIEYCAGTAFQLIGGAAGGVGGHGFTFVNGLCRDESKNYPQVKICDGTEGYAGVGISVNSDFQNVNWVAIPTHALLLDGAIRDGERITNAVVDRVANAAVKKRIFDGVKIKPELTVDAWGRLLEPGTADYLSAVAKNSLGTDYGTRFARNLECVRFPFESSRLQAIADRLNALNDSYYKTGKIYEWSGLTNNCAHVASDILEEAGVRNSIPKNSYLNLAIPRNGVYTLVQKGFYGPTAPRSVWSNDADQASILSNQPSIVARVGVLAKLYPGFADNDVYELSSKALWVLPSSMSHFLEARAAFNTPTAEVSQIRANLEYWKKRYAHELEAIRSDRTFMNSATYEKFRSRYAAYLRLQLRFVSQSLRRL